MNRTIIYGADNYPTHVLMDGGRAVMSSPMTKAEPIKDVVPSRLEEEGKSWFVNWGDSNDLPREVIGEVRKNAVASQAVRLIVQAMYGQKVIPCRVVEIDPNTGKETLEYVNDPEILAFLERCNIDVLRAHMFLDYVVLGNVFPILHLNDTRTEIVTITHDKAAKFRYAPFDTSKNRIDSVFRSANWPSPTEDQYDEFKLINSKNWFYDVERIRQESEVQYVYPINCLDILNDYYALAPWMAIYINNSLKNSNAIPAIEASIIKNIWSIKYHIEIARSYWEYMYPNFAQMSLEQRNVIVNKLYDDMNNFLSGKDNQMKTFISTFGVDQNGKPVPGIIINVLDDKDKTDKWIPNATNANNETLFAFGVQPAIFGLGPPGGGAAGAQTGGSNIREGWLVLLARMQLDRDLNYGWWPFVKTFNNWDSTVVLRTMDKILTTLDSGAGTAKPIS